MKRFKNRISILLFITIVCGTFMPAVSVGALGIPAQGWDTSVGYRCSFDIPLTKDFREHPVYQYTNNGILHVEALACFWSLFTIGTGQKKITIQVSRRRGDSTWARNDGEYEISGYLTSKFVWDEEIINEKDGFVLKNARSENIFPAIGSQSNPDLALDMVLSDEGMMIRMYLFDDQDISGVIKPCSKIAQYDPESFEEEFFTEDEEMKEYRGDLFKRDGIWETAIEGTEEGDALYQKREDLLNSIQDPKPTEAPEETQKPQETEKPDTGGINTGPNVQKDYQGLTKEESIEQFSGYYDENEVYHLCSFYTGSRKGTRYESTLNDKVDFTVYKNFNGISSEQKTNFTLYDVHRARYDMETGKLSSDRVGFSLLRVSGNLGEKWFRDGQTAWHITEGTTTSSFPDLDSQSAYYGWQEVVEITDTYIDNLRTDVADITLHFANEARTGLRSISFHFDGLSCETSLENIDYTGPFLSYFLPNLYGDRWEDMAKAFGLTPTAE